MGKIPTRIVLHYLGIVFTGNLVYKLNNYLEYHTCFR